MFAKDFNYELPVELIAQHPRQNRADSRLLVLHRNTGRIEHRTFRDFPSYLKKGDVLTINDSRVIPARLRASKPPTGARVEVFLVEENAANDWWVMLRPGKRVRKGTQLLFQNSREQPCGVEAIVVAKNSEGHCRLNFSGTSDILMNLDNMGEVPLPPYIERPDGPMHPADDERYQTVYAKEKGSVAAPTAGLHFNMEQLEEIRSLGAEVCSVTLHVGLGTFAPVKTDRIADHIMHAERFALSESTASAIEACKKSGNRVISVGTTSLRTLESAAAMHRGRLRKTCAKTRLFVYPPFRFLIVDALLTNFHMPQSTLLMLVCAFAAPNETLGRDLVLSAYDEAVRERYRFFSYGDAMLVI